MPVTNITHAANPHVLRQSQCKKRPITGGAERGRCGKRHRSKKCDDYQTVLVDCLLVRMALRLLQLPLALPHSRRFHVHAKSPSPTAVAAAQAAAIAPNTLAVSHVGLTGRLPPPPPRRERRKRRDQRPSLPILPPALPLDASRACSPARHACTRRRRRGGERGTTMDSRVSLGKAGRK